jgi:hypothetical protein
LSNAADRNDLILELCESRGISWAQAEALIQHVETDRKHEIAGRQLPLLLFIALLIFLGGLGLVAYCVYELISILLTGIRAGLPGLDVVSYWRLIFDIGVGPLAGLAIGAAMLLGSLVGMRRAWMPLIEYFSERISHARR